MDDTEDPHDLAFPSAHFARQSVVDNLVMSLDRVSPTASHDYNRASPRKTRPHTQAERSRPRRDPLNTIFGDEEDTHRAKAYGAQRAAQVSKLKSNERPSARSRSSSNSSSVDLGHLAPFAGRLGHAGNRRSQSFDFGSKRPPKPLLDAADIAPASRAYASQPVESQTETNNPPALQRKNSGRSAKTATRSTKRRSGTVGANTMRPRNDSPQALPPIRNPAYDNERKLPPPPLPDAAATFSRPGFFKRVFGSAKATTPGTSSSTATPGLPAAHDRSGSLAEPSRPSTPPPRQVKQTTKTPTEAASSRDVQPVVTKKPSSFFRRRKKSINNGIPAPMPLILSSLQSEKAVDAPSPVSSLKALMDPYLATETDSRHRHGRGGSIHSIINVTPKPVPQRNLDLELSQASAKHNRRPSAKSLTKLEIPQKTLDMTHGVTTSTVRKIEKSPPVPKATSVSMADKSLSPALMSASVVPREQRSPQKAAVDATKSNAISRTVSATSGGPSSPSRRQTHTSFTSDKGPTSGADSDVSIYKSAPSTPIVQELPSKPMPRSPHVHVSQPSISQAPDLADEDKARRLYQNPNDELIGTSTACAWLGDGASEREGVRKAYMELFDFGGKPILGALRTLCSKMVLRGETQQVDRIIDAFSRRWCVCNSNHGFKSSDVVHTVCYSVLLLNTDLHLADIGQKMTRTQFIRNAMGPIRQVASDADLATTSQSSQFLAVRTNSYHSSSASVGLSSDSQGRSPSALSGQPSDRVSKDESRDPEGYNSLSSPLVDAPYTGSQGGWELQVEAVLKEFYSSISRDPLPLFGQTSKLVVPPGNNSLLGLSGLRRTPSTLSKAQSENRGRPGLETKSLGSRWARKTASRVRLGPTPSMGASRTSLDDGSSNWSPLSSTWSRVSLGKTLTSMSVDSFGTEHAQADYQSSIGFANALSQAIIRDEQLESHFDEGLKATPLLEDESLELQGAPWAKEGILKHKCHLEGVDKRSKDRNWNDCFAVIEKGWMRLFSFSNSAKSVRSKGRNQKGIVGGSGVVGGGNWQDNAEEVWKFMLRHTIASTLPPPGYSKLRPFVWALSLPNGAVHLFSVGTPDIVKEFVSTANFWSARLSKEPIAAGVSSMEYGWSDNVINRALVSSESQSVLGPGSPRPSTQMSLRGSIDHGSIRPRLPGDKIHISQWNPPQQSLTPSQLMEVDQHKALQNYVKNVEEELTRHNELRPAMLMAFSSRHPNSQKAMTNWEKKSSYLLHEIVKFSTYVDALTNSQKCREKVYKMREEDKAAREAEQEAELKGQVDGVGVEAF